MPTFAICICAVAEFCRIFKIGGNVGGIDKTWCGNYTTCIFVSFNKETIFRTNVKLMIFMALQRQIMNTFKRSWLILPYLLVLLKTVEVSGCTEYIRLAWEWEYLVPKIEMDHPCAITYCLNTFKLTPWTYLLNRLWNIIVCGCIVTLVYRSFDQRRVNYKCKRFSSQILWLRKQCCAACVNLLITMWSRIRMGMRNRAIRLVSENAHSCG